MARFDNLLKVEIFDEGIPIPSHRVVTTERRLPLAGLAYEYGTSTQTILSLNARNYENAEAKPATLSYFVPGRSPDFYFVGGKARPENSSNEITGSYLYTPPSSAKAGDILCRSETLAPPYFIVGYYNVNLMDFVRSQYKRPNGEWSEPTEYWRVTYDDPHVRLMAKRLNDGHYDDSYYATYRDWETSKGTSLSNVNIDKKLLSAKELLEHYSKTDDGAIPAGFKLWIPRAGTTTSSLIDSSSSSSSTSSIVSVDEDDYKFTGSSKISGPVSDQKCYFQVYYAGVQKYAYYLPVYPEEFSDNNSARFSPVAFLGRSVESQVYTGSSREVSLTLTLHEELVDQGLTDQYDYIRSMIKTLQAACYPEYTPGGRVGAPEILLRIRDEIKIRGVLTSCNAQGKAPIINDRYVCHDLSLTIVETAGPYSGSYVKKNGGFR